jgi:hypothetical protein
VDRSEKHVKAKTPVRQPSEEAERLPDSSCIVVRSIPAPEEEDGGKNVECDQAAQTG